MMAAVLRWCAIAMAVLGVFDPPVPAPRRERPPIRVTVDDPPLVQALRDAGFQINTSDPPAAIIVSALSTEHRALSTPVFAIGYHREPDVAIIRATASDRRVPGQAFAVSVGLIARGVAGTTTEIVLEDAGLAVASQKHAWTKPDESWQASLLYLPPGAGMGVVRVRAVPVAQESHTENNVADVAIPPMRGPIRTLIVEAGVTWPALFVRRALEGEPGFEVSALQRTTKALATRSGSPPPALTRDALAPFEVVIAGGPDALSARDVESLRWFVEERGGVAVFVPDRSPVGPYTGLIGSPVFDGRTLAAAEPLPSGGGALQASEMLVPRTMPAMTSILASDASRKPIVFAARRGAGAVIFSGALDAWRFRGPAFDEFWRRAVAAEAALVPPRLDVIADPAAARPSERVRVFARIRSTEIGSGDRVSVPPIFARAASPAARSEEPVRLWPTEEPGVYEGEWRPAREGRYAIDVTAGSLQASAPVIVGGEVVHPARVESEALAALARASGGAVFDAPPALTAALQRALPAGTVWRSSHPARTLWWVTAFAALVSMEWWLRRRRGLP